MAALHPRQLVGSGPATIGILTPPSLRFPNPERVMKFLTLVLMVCCLFAPAANAQTRAQLKKELATKLEGAASAEDKMKVAEWAKEVGLVTDYKKVLKQILETTPDFTPALDALGYVQFDGKWMPAEEAEAHRKSAMAAAFKERGLVEVDGVWVEKEKADDAKNGLFWHDGEAVSKDEKMGFLEGKVRHPKTGQLIAKEHLDKAQQGLFPVEERWVDQEEADKYHAQMNRPWVIRTKHATLMTTLSFAWVKDLSDQIDPAIERLLPIFGNRTPSAEHRPLVGVAANQQEYVAVGTRIGGPGSAYGAFLAEQDLSTQGVAFKGRPAVAVWEQNWGPYNVRHAAGLALVHSLCLDAKAEVPLWFQHAVAGLVDRLWNEQTTKFFGDRFVQNGGVTNLEDWFQKFAINPDMETEAMWSNIYQAALVLDFCIKGGDKACTKALEQIAEALEKGGAELGKAVTRLEQTIGKKAAAVRKYARQG